MLKLKNIFKIIATTAVLATIEPFVNAQEPNPYEGFKLPPLEIPSTTKYT